ncbi:TM2 domain-containing protein [Kaistia dalseonensis]|uniref:TM2 domain-containing membrane protein YozV n=1 Tax=Kaistia dalseonensis TaxID=410840 RepID=A0ABU0H3A2_9HYPH|nr:TM2 domain-containing protein [Kaistia dalseonensis]MCX5493398.1 TM2 domain-containing protein [Kaistia dalseonensis]MDQ0435956.1 TM2 domain-containing membrane protein YozV [Kaistia dalseonensis]
MSLTTQDKLLIEQRVTNEGPNIVVAYLFWLFLWFVSAHRFYLGRPKSAVLQILSYFIVIGFVWILVDIFLIPGMIRERQQQIRDRLAFQMLQG